MKTTRSFRPIAAAASLVLALSAGAQDAEPEGAGTIFPRDRYPWQELVRRPLSLSAGLSQLDLPLQSNLSSGAVGKPVSVPLALSYGVTDDVTAGIFHETGICLSGRANGCVNTRGDGVVYDDLGVGGTLGLLRTPAQQLVAQASLLVRNFVEAFWDGTLGAAYKRTLSPLAAVVAQANLGIALNQRDARLANEAVALQVEGQLQLAPALAGAVRVGMSRALGVRQGFTADTQVPVGLAIEWAPLRRVNVGASFDFTNLLGQRATAEERLGRVYGRLYF